MDEIRIEDAVKSVDRAAIGVCAGFAIGFLLGASVVAVIDYYDNKKAQLKRIKRDSDENYIYSE
ncbi:MAG: hypothetical protein K2J47_09460 [Ruminococcus sp.]|nr:hypothetical protein [Ruminococcus sp.]